jgi:hypothetical protein
MNCFSEVNDGNKISPRSANSRAVQVDRGEKTMVAKRMHAIRKAFILEIYVTNMVMLSYISIALLFIATMIFSSIRRELYILEIKSSRAQDN